MSDRGIVIVDYGMGNLFSVARAFEAIGVRATISADPADVVAAAGVVLPGVGAMPEAMRALDAGGLSHALRHAAGAGTPMLGICLGLQLFMTEGSEFRPHRGLGIIPGVVRRFEGVDDAGRALKVPHIGWSRIEVTHPAPAAWPRRANMYFVHSFYVVPEAEDVVAARTRYGSVEFCSALASGTVLGCQFHPERSGSAGLRLLRTFAGSVRSSAVRPVTARLAAG